MNEIIFIMSTNEKEHVQLNSLHGTLDGERVGGGGYMQCRESGPFLKDGSGSCFSL
jgi:hypothetical protein